MNLTHLGDALDHWKGSMFDLMSDSLRELHVVPMFTDEDPADLWTPARLGVYARLLRVSTRQILLTGSRFMHATRSQYFSDGCLDADCDLFVDPDTGIIGDDKSSPRHVRPRELAGLLPQTSERVILVYQHAFRDKDFARKTLTQVRESHHCQGVVTFAYNAGAVALVLLSRSSQRLTALQDRLKLIAGDERRIVK